MYWSCIPSFSFIPTLSTQLRFLWPLPFVVSRASQLTFLILLVESNSKGRAQILFLSETLQWALLSEALVWSPEHGLRPPTSHDLDEIPPFTHPWPPFKALCPCKPRCPAACPVSMRIILVKEHLVCAGSCPRYLTYTISFTRHGQPVRPFLLP